jgi:phage terminase small subunit
MNLTEKRKRFCDEYLIDLNATQAAIRAGYSRKTANEQAGRLLVNVSVKTYIQEKQKAASKRLEISLDMILEGYRKLAFYDVRKFYGEKGSLKDVKDLDDETAFALTGVDVTEEKAMNVVTGYTKKIKMSDRKGALDSICRVLGFNAPEKHEVSAEQKFMELLMKSGE